MEKSAEILETVAASTLSALARKLGLPKTITRKGDLISALHNQLKKNLHGIISLLPDPERKLLAETAYHGGILDAGRFEAKYRIACPTINRDSYYRADSNLSLLSLFFGAGYGQRSLATEMTEALRAVLSKPPADQVQTVDELPGIYKPPEEKWHKPEARPIHIHEGESVAFTELRTVLRFAQAGKLKVTDKTRRPTDATVRLIGSSLAAADFQLDEPADSGSRWVPEPGGPVRAHAWGAIIQQCGWARARAGRLTLTPEGQKLLGGITPEAFRGGFDALLLDEAFDELNRINHIRGQSGRGKRYLTPPGGRRVAICGSMANWPVNRWVAFDEAARFLRAEGKRFEVTGEAGTLYFGELQYGMLGGQHEDINRQYMRAVFLETLGSLGVIDVAYAYPHGLWPELGDSWGIDEVHFCSRYDGLLYIRLNALGAFCLGITKTYDRPVATAGPILRVLPNRDVAVTDAARFSAGDQHLLNLFAGQKSEYVWELDPERILAHLEKGGSTGELLEFLDTTSGNAVPATVRTMLEDLENRCAPVFGLEEAILLEFKDEAVAALVAHDAQAGKHCHAAAGRRLAVPKKHWRAFRGAMRKLQFIIPDDRSPI